MQQRSRCITRSESRAISDSDFEMHSRNRALQGPSRDIVVDNLAGPSSRNLRKGQTNVTQELATVPEQSDIAYPVLAQNIDVLQNHPLGKGNHNGRTSKSSSKISAISENITQPKFSEPKLTDNDSEAMLDALPDLYETAKKLLAFVAPQNHNSENHVELVKDMQYTNSRANKNLMRLVESLRLQQKSYAKPFINPTRAVKALLNITPTSKVGYGHWPDNIFYEVNLAVMAAGLVSPSENFGNHHQMLKRLKRDYPWPFFLQSSDKSSELDDPTGSSELMVENSQFGIEIQTQYLISLLDRHSQEPNFDPEKLLLWVFDVDRDSKSEIEINTITERVKDRMQAIEEMFGEYPHDMPDLPAICIDLQATFPWSNFVHDALSWVNLRRNEIEAQIRLVGGLEGIVKGIEDDINSRALSEAPRSSSDHEVDAEVTPDLPSAQLRHESEQAYASFKARDTASKRNLKDLKDKFVEAPKQRVVTQMVAEAKAKQSASKPRALQEPNLKDPEAFGENKRLDAVAQNEIRGKAARVEAQTIDNSFDGFQPQMDQDELIILDDNEGFIHAKRPSMRESVVAGKKKERFLQSHDRLEAQKQARVLIDPQSKSKRPRFDTDQGTSQRSRIDSERGVRRNNRTISPSEEEEGFQDDVRSEFPLRSKPVTSTSRVRPEPLSNAPIRYPRVRDGSIVLDQEPTHTAEVLTQSEMYREVNKQSKVTTALTVPKPLQNRQGWSNEEIQTLLDLIEEYGTSWTLLKQKDAENGNILANRGQVALKDKARNIKFDYLKMGSEMPVNFEHVRLNKALVDKLRAACILVDDEE